MRLSRAELQRASAHLLAVAARYDEEAELETDGAKPFHPSVAFWQKKAADARYLAALLNLDANESVAEREGG